MAKRTVAVISEDERLYRLVEAELLLLGYEVEKYKNIKNKSKEFYGIIYDHPVDNSLYLLNSELKVILVRADLTGEERSALAKHGIILEYPFLLDEFRSVMLSHDKKEATAKNIQTQDKHSVIYYERDTSSVVLRGKSIKLSDYEYKTLELLCKNSGKCVSRAKLTETLGGLDGNIADVYICHLRKKLEAPFGIKIITTVRNKGYMTNFILK